MDSKSILTICVNYQNDKETANFLSGLLSLDGYDDQLVLVVNNEQTRHGCDRTLLEKAQDDRVILKYSEKNLGYFGGANWCLQAYLKDNPLPEWVIISNTDIEFPDPRLFIKILKYYHTNSPAVIAPDIQLNPRGLLQSSPIHQNPHFENRPSRRRISLIYWISFYANLTP